MTLTTASSVVRLAPKRVVMLYSMSFQPYQGWYRRALNEAKALAEAGCQVTLLAWDRDLAGPVEETLDGVHVRRLQIKAPTNVGPRNAVNHLKFNRAVLSYLASHPFDVVHCFNVDTMLCGLRAARRHGKKCVLDLCEPDYYRGFWSRRLSWLLHGVNWLEKTLAKRFDHLIVHNTYQVEKFRAAGLSRITQVGSYPNRSLLTTQVGRPPSDTVVVGRLGTVYANNGFEEVALAFGRLLERQARRGDRTHYKLRLAGKVFDDYRPTFEALIRPLEGHVEVTGAFNVADLPQLYRQIDLSLLLYGKDAFGHVTPTKLFESLACGVPVIANAIGDTAGIVGEGPCGLIVDETDPESICAGIERLAGDAGLRQRMAEAGVRLVHDRYSWESVRDQFLDVYRNL